MVGYVSLALIFSDCRYLQFLSEIGVDLDPPRWKIRHPPSWRQFHPLCTLVLPNTIKKVIKEEGMNIAATLKVSFVHLTLLIISPRSPDISAVRAVVICLDTPETSFPNKDLTLTMILTLVFTLLLKVTADANTPRKRRSRWGDTKTEIPGLPTAISSTGISQAQLENYAIQHRLEEINRKLRLNDYIPPENER